MRSAFVNDSGLVTAAAFENIPQLVSQAKLALREYIENLTRKYEIRKSARSYPVIAFLGPGRAGKDTAAIYISQKYEPEYSGSVSEFVNPLVAYALQESPVECFHNRHRNRLFWKEFCNQVRREDPSFLVRMCLAGGDMIVGIRARVELEACIKEGVIQQTWWVDNPRVPTDPTLEFSMDDCDFSIRNSGDLPSFFKRLKKLAEIYSFPERTENAQQENHETAT